MESADDCKPLVWRNTPNYIPELEDYEVPEDWWRNGYGPLDGSNTADEATKFSREHCKIPPPPKNVFIEPPKPIIIEKPVPVIIERPHPVVERPRPVVIERPRSVVIKRPQPVIID